MLDKDIAIRVEHLSKTFRIPHEKVSSLRGAFVGMFQGKRTFEEFQALDDVSFEVKKGEFFGIIGRNGSGKSTLLKILAGIYQPDKGKVTVNGMISPFLELGIGFNPELSGRDNVYLNATVLGLTKKQIDKKFNDIVAFSELERFIDQKLKNYSSGMQVRLAFSVAIHANRDILLMDEVLAVGDSNFQRKCLDFFKEFKKQGRTIVLVTHDMGTVLNFCERAILLNEGKLISEGDPTSVLKQYASINSEQTRKNISGESLRSKWWGSGEIVIDAVEMYTESSFNIDSRTIFSGDLVIFRVRFHSDETVIHPVFGLGIHSEDDDSYCVALNSSIDGYVFERDALKRGYIDITIPEFNLNQGRYYMNIVVGDGTIHLNHPVFFESKIKVFEVRNREYNEARFRLNHTWSSV